MPILLSNINEPYLGRQEEFDGLMQVSPIFDYQSIWKE